MLWNVPWWTLTFRVIWNIKTKHRTVAKTVLSLETSTCVQRLEGSSFSCDALRADVEPATFRAHTVSNQALMSFVHQQVGKCKISGFFGGSGRKCGRGLEGGAAVGRGILKLSNSSLVVLRKALPFSFPHFSDARPSTWKQWSASHSCKHVVGNRLELAAPVSGPQTFNVGGNESCEGWKEAEGAAQLNLV